MPSCPESAQPAWRIAASRNHTITITITISRNHTITITITISRNHTITITISRKHTITITISHNYTITISRNHTITIFCYDAAALCTLYVKFVMSNANHTEMHKIIYTKNLICEFYEEKC